MSLFDDSPTTAVTDQKSADISPCGRYRYLLSRTWDASLPRCGWIMLNPSTADAVEDDPTIRRCVAFAKAWGCGGIEVANLFAMRSPYPGVLIEADDPVGPENDQRILAVASRCQPLVAAWGQMGSLMGRETKVVAMIEQLRLRRRDVPKLQCLGTTQSGRPRHPLYIRGDMPLSPFPPVPVLVEA